MLVVRTVDGVEDVAGGVLETLTEGVILTLVVVISHITLELLWGVDGGLSSLLYSDLVLGSLRELWSSGLSVNGVSLVKLCLVEARVVLGVLLSERSGSAVTIFTLGDIDLRVGVVGGRTVGGTVVSVEKVGISSLELTVCVAAEGLLIAVEGRMGKSQARKKEWEGMCEGEGTEERI